MKNPRELYCCVMLWRPVDGTVFLSLKSNDRFVILACHDSIDVNCSSRFYDQVKLENTWWLLFTLKNLCLAIVIKCSSKDYAYLIKTCSPILEWQPSRLVVTLIFRANSRFVMTLKCHLLFLEASRADVQSCRVRFLMGHYSTSTI